MDTATPAPIPEPESTPSLLPAVLCGPFSFLWLWVLPIAVLMTLNVQGYWVIEGNMDPGQHRTALILGYAGLADLVAGLALFFLTWRLEKAPASPWARHPLWGVPALAAQIAYLWLAFADMDTVLPQSVIVWIYPPERFLFNQFAFAMIPLFLGVLRVACAKPMRRAAGDLAISAVLACGAPVALYIGLNTLRWFDHGLGSSTAVILATTVILLSLAMFAGIIRSLMLAFRFARDRGPVVERVAIVIVAVVLPVSGLLLNRTIPFPADFQAWEVYGLTLANAAILLFASWRHAQQPRLSFSLLCLTLPFSLYFFIVFLPYTPLSILAVILMGAGFLVLAPTFLFTLHLHLFNKARSEAGRGWSGLRMAVAGLLCFLVVPAFFTMRGLADKAALNAALDYLFTPAIKSGDTRYPASLSNLRRALNSHRNYKNGIYYPLLSDYYSWLVFDDLILPDDKLARLEKVFLGATGSTENHDLLRSRNGSLFGGRSVRDRARMPRATPPPRTVEVSGLDVRARPAGGADAVFTVVMTLRNTGSQAAEYRRTLPLPPGVFVDGFRLHINGTPVPGRIFEKKTALWVYAMIRDSERRDPGLLVYNKPDELELRVYPVAADKPATVEIDFLIPGRPGTADAPVASRDPAAVLAWLGGAFSPQLAADPRGGFLAGTFAPRLLPVVERQPYLHLIVDRSADNGFTGDIPAALRALQKKFPEACDARITLANYDIVDLAPRLTPISELANGQLPDATRALPAGGGLALDLALAHAIRQHRDADLDGVAGAKGVPERPVFVILSRKAGLRPLDLEVAGAWSDLVPGLEIHELGADGAMVTHRSSGCPDVPLLRLGRSVRSFVAGVATRFAADGDTDRLEYWSPDTAQWLPVADVRREEDASPWSRAVSLQLQQQDHGRNPGAAAVDLAALVKGSRESGILLASTSYIVVENEAQWRTLESSERQKLGQNAALNFRETPAPPAVAVALGFGLWLAIRRRRGSRRM
jgi:hypothetical protein